jgi:hypothetical protein
LLEGNGSNSDENWNDAGKYLDKHPKEVLVWLLKRFIKDRAYATHVCFKVLTLPFWLPWKLPALFAQADTRTFALNVVKTVMAALGLIATFVAGIGLIINY